MGLGPGGFITVRVREGKLGKDFMEGMNKKVGQRLCHKNLML